jgi:tripartite ATP-independent transporter DctP family solute receptor
MHHRRSLLRACGALAACAVAGGARATTKPRTLRMAYLLPRASHLGAGTSVMATEVANQTQGRLLIKHFPDSALGGEVDVLKALQIGAIDLAFTTGSPLGAILPDAGIFNIPFLFRDIAHAQAVMDGPIGDEYARLLADKGVVPLAWGENGMRHITNSQHPVRDPADLHNLRLRVPQSPVMLAGMRALGADAKALAFPLLYEALQTGLFDGQENPIATIIAAQFAQVQAFLTLSAHVYDPALILMSPDTFNDLSAGDQAILRQAARLGAAESRRFAASAQTSGIAGLQRAGMQVVDSIDRARFTAAVAGADPAYQKLFSARQLAEIRAAA